MRKRRYAKPNEKLTDAESYFLKGPVKLVMETCYKAHLNDGIVEQGKIEAEGFYNETNYITEFSEQGMRVSEVSYGAGSYRLQRFNAAGQETESETFYNQNHISRTKYTYNEKGQPIEHVHKDKEDKVQSRIVYTYTDIGQQQESVIYNGAGEVRSRSVYTYEEPILVVNGIQYRQMRSNIEYKADGSIERKSLSTYDERGNNIESITEYTDENKQQYNQRTVKKFNEHNDCIELNMYNADGSIKHYSTYSYEYDSEGKKIIPPREPAPDPYGLKPGETEQFENDSHGNWIKRTLFFENVPVNIMLRQINYYGEEPAYPEPFVHPVTLSAPEEIKEKSNSLRELEPAEAKWLAEGTNTADAFPVHRYYAMNYKEIPCTVNFSNAYIEAFAVLKQLEDRLGAEIIHSTGTIRNGWNERLTRYTLRFTGYYGYLLQATNINRYEDDEYVVPTYVQKLIPHAEQLYFSSFTLYRPSQASGKRDEWFEDMLSDYIDECTLRRKPEKPFINIIETTQGGFTMKEHQVDDNFEIRDLDVNYGYGFQQFHSDLMQRFNSSTKGLVLFHGQPGTGKTYYIRHLLRKMVANRKVVIYMPPNMVDHLVEPAFMTFLAHEVRRWSAEGNFCVLLIEDAEPLLAKRQEGVRIQGVTNLLNLSDGLLNDMLNLQIICTFNVDLKKLDSALLRPGRLIARKEFKPLGELDANLLAQRLGIKHHFKKPATLSEIYAMRKNQNTLIHDVEPDRDASTLLDDL